MNLKKQLKNICNELGVEVSYSPVDELCGCYGLYEPDENRILIDPRCDDDGIYEQVLIHEIGHVLDPKCKGGEVDPREVDECEYRAELLSKYVLGDDYVDDGYIDSLYIPDIDVQLNCIDQVEVWSRKIIKGDDIL